MGSAEGFVGSGSVEVGEGRRQVEGACSSGAPRDENRVVTTSLRAVWSKSPDSELSTEGRESSRLQDDETSKEHGFTLGNAKSHLILALKAEVLLQKCSKLKKSSSRCAKRPVMVQMEVSKSKVVQHDVNEVSNALASSPANYHISVVISALQRFWGAQNFSKHALRVFLSSFVIEKTQVFKQKNSYNCRRGDKRNSKVHKNRCDFILFEGWLVVFNSAAVGKTIFVEGMFHSPRSKVHQTPKNVLRSIAASSSRFHRLDDDRCSLSYMFYAEVEMMRPLETTYTVHTRITYTFRKAIGRTGTAKKENITITSTGIYGLKSELTDITKYVNELSLDELLCGRYDYSSIAKDKGKSVSNSNSNFLQSYRKACSILQDQKVHQTQKCAEINSSFIQQVSTGSMMTGSATDQIDFNRGESLTAELPSSDKVKESGDEIKLSKSVSDSPLYLPKYILERLTLPLPKDLDSLLSDAHKTTSSSKSCDPRLGKTLFQQTGLPSFPWSHSFSGHSKLGADSVKLSTSRTMCNARWFKVKSSSTPQKDPVSSVWDIESLTFDQNLVPKVNLTSGSPENQTASVERVLSSSGASSTSRVPEDEHSPTYAAAKMLCDMATSSLKENLCTRVKLLKKPPQMAKKAWKSKASEKPTKLFDTPKSTRRPHNPVKVGGVGSPLKKLRLSTDVKHACIGHTDSVKRETLHWSARMPPTSPSTTKL
ncbi:UNVERIFIED_CONTAM: hypothetical protein Scaly_2691900 [Sesamum calycinum]|uniref:Uncharacterized protein n=1 Tax=Sesamum calycinum TaxID=2727403 RepID=A0AAW2J606_9LAMI